MKRLILLAVLLCIAPSARGAVSTRVCLADGNTPLDCNEVMVGTKLTIIVESDEPGFWEGSIALLGEDVNLAVLPWATPLEAAGPYADAYMWVNQGIQGFDMQTDPRTGKTLAGEWFIIDYIADDTGNCKVGFFDEIDYDPPYEPTWFIELTHVPTRDFDDSTLVDFADFAVLASFWLQPGCGDCGGADLSGDNDVDFEDLMLFTDYWLESTE